jgi:hypothetical protein
MTPRGQYIDGNWYSTPTDGSVRAGLVIYKFTLRPWTIFVDVPNGARVLSVGSQNGDVVAWVLCDPDAPKVSRSLAAYPTSVPLPYACNGTEFVGTVQMADGLVFHVFDGGERS